MTERVKHVNIGLFSFRLIIHFVSKVRVGKSLIERRVGIGKSLLQKNQMPLACSAQETEDGSQVRIDKIYKIIAECRYGAYDNA